MTGAAAPADWPDTETMQAVAVQVGACLHPIMHRLTDTLTGETTLIPLPCGATWAGDCPACAERNRRLRMQQCREGWHLEDDPLPPIQPDEDPDQEPCDDDKDQADEDSDEPVRLTRSTRRRPDMPNLPRNPERACTVGRVFTGRDGRTYRPSMFLTVTLPSYGAVNQDGTPRDRDTYDYRRAAMDAMHFGKLIDRLFQNLRRAAGFRLQYFAVVEPQRRLAPHLHVAIRGVMPRRDIAHVIAGTYAQVWWPSCEHPVYTDPLRLPVWTDGEGGQGRFADSETGELLPTWDEARQDLERPAHMVIAGDQHDVRGLLPGTKADKTIGYLAKYLGKSITEGMAPAGTELTGAQRAHVERLADEGRWLPCSPDCPNWLRYGITPRRPDARMSPGHCGKRAHWPERAGYGGRRVLVSRYWTGKTLTEHAADRRETVRAALEAISEHMAAGCSATELRPDGLPRWRYEPATTTNHAGHAYRAALAESVRQRLAWREQYQRARDRAGPFTAA